MRFLFLNFFFKCLEFEIEIPDFPERCANKLAIVFFLDILTTVKIKNCDTRFFFFTDYM
jgi:hypothetical protein